MLRLSAAIAASALLVTVSNVGCSSNQAPVGDGCVGENAAALKTCAKGTTITGVDISYYQGDVSWAQIKGSGRQFGFTRISDGLKHPDTRFEQNWLAMKSVGLVRGSYQYFRASQDVGLQVQLVIDALADAGGLQAGDLPPVLDLESSDGVGATEVVARAKAWLAAVETTIHAKPIVYTSAAMSDVIGNAFSGYVLWVAHYTTGCPLMPAGWNDWQFWQNSESGTVPGVSGGADTDFFNGTLPELQALTLTSTGVAPRTAPAIRQTGPSFAGRNTPNDGSQGATIGHGDPSDTAETQSAPLTPCR